MAQRDADPKSIKDVLGAFVETNKLQKGFDKVNVADAWRDVMGPAIAKYTTCAVAASSAAAGGGEQSHQRQQRSGK